MHPTPFLIKISQFSLSLVWFYDYKPSLMNWYSVFSLLWMFSKFPYQTLPILSLLFLPLFWFFSHSFVNLHFLNLFFPSYIQTEEFLIEWEGHSTHQCTWEPKRHIPEAILNDYKAGAPSLSASAIQHISDQFLSALQQRPSRRTGGHFYLEIPLPVHHQLFGTERKEFLFHKEDFGRFHFALEKWDEFIYT